MPSALPRVTIRADPATFARLDAAAARAGFASRAAFMLHAALHHEAARADARAEARTRALAAVAQALHALHLDARAGRPDLSEPLLGDLTRRARRALGTVGAGARARTGRR